MTFEEMLRTIVREEVRAALAEMPLQQPPKEYMTMSEAAELGRLSYSTIKAWVRSGRLASEGEARSRRITPDQLKAAIAWKPKGAESADEVARRMLETLTPRQRGHHQPRPPNPRLNRRKRSS